MKKIFIAATGQNAGKTTTSLGLISALQSKTPRIGFIKPVGQRYVETPQGRFDEDAVLVDEEFKLGLNLSDMSPVTVDRTFTRDYIEGKIEHHLERKIIDSFNKVAEGKDLVVIEGTGHAGVGSVIGLSNARVAKILNAPVLIVSTGGIGRPIDEIALNYGLFHLENVPILGVILNKVASSKLDMINTVTRKGLASMGINFFGAIPDDPLLASPTMSEILQEINGTLVNGEALLNRPVQKIVIGAMTPHQFLDHFEDNMLVITGGDREDLILAAMSSSYAASGDGGSVAGMILTGGINPHKNILALIRRTPMPVIVVKEDSYRVASKVHDLTTKIQPKDHAKLGMVRKLVAEHVDIEAIFNSI